MVNSKPTCRHGTFAQLTITLTTGESHERGNDEEAGQIGVRDHRGALGRNWSCGSQGQRRDLRLQATHSAKTSKQTQKANAQKQVIGKETAHFVLTARLPTPVGNGGTTMTTA